MRYIICLLVISEVCANASVCRFPLVIRRDYDDVITEASIVAANYRSIDEVADPAFRKIFSDTYELIQAINQGESIKARQYAFEGAGDLVNAFCRKYKGVLSSVNVRGLVVMGKIPVVFWSLENGEKSLTRYFTYRVTADGDYLWDPSFSDPVISLIASSYQRAVANNESVQTFAAIDMKSLDRSMLGFRDLDLPFIDWGFFPHNSLLGDSLMPESCQDGLAAFEYGEKVLKSGSLGQYATMLTGGSKRKYTQWSNGLNADQQRQYIDDYFAYEKEILAVVDAAPFVIILYRHVVPEHLAKEQSTRVAYMIKEPTGNIYRTNVSFEGYLDDFLKEYDPFSSDTIRRMAKKFLKN